MSEVLLKPGEAVLSNWFLNNYVSFNLSELSLCCFLPLSIDHNQWLNNFILNSAFKYKYENPTKARIFNFLRRTHNAIISYDLAREELEKYLGSPPNTISTYFVSLYHFENCIGQCYEATLFLKALAKIDKLFDPRDGSVLSKINNVHNSSKHMDERISKGKMPNKSTVPIWISNIGIETKDCIIKGEELNEFLMEIYEWSEKICNPERFLSRTEEKNNDL